MLLKDIMNIVICKRLWSPYRCMCQWSQAQPAFKQLIWILALYTHALHGKF